MSTVELANELREDVRGITREEYDALIAAGLLEDQKVELLRGLIVEMAAKGVPHDSAIEWFTWRLTRGLSEDYRVRPQSAWAASSNSQPEPDLAVVPADWRQRTPRTHPQVAELVIEVADSSLRRDLRVKAAIYAEAGVPRYWVVDVNSREVVVHTDPVDGVYQSIERVGPPAVLTVLGVELPLADLFVAVFPFDG